jgi:tetratricopeptide (TPR) repeat protein
MKKILCLSVLFIITSASAVFADTFESLIDEGDKLFYAGKYIEAEQYFSKAIDAAPGNAKGYWYRGDALFYIKKYSEAEKDYTKSIKIDPSNFKVFKRRGSCYYNRNMFREALSDYSQAIILNPADGELRLYRGDCYRQLKENNNALSDYKKADSLGNKDAGKYINILTLEAHNTLFASLKNIRIDPFTGTVIKAGGLTFESIEIVPKKENAYITGNDIPLNFPFSIKIGKPGNFNKDKAGDVFLSAGFGVYDNSGKELAAIEDMYKDNNQGLPSEFLTSLSMTINLTGPLEPGTDGLLKIWFIDKRGNGRIDVLMPFHVAKEASLSNSILSTESVLGTGVSTKAVYASAEGISIFKKENPVSFDSLASGQSYVLKVSGFKKSEAVSYSTEFIGEDGLSIKKQTGKVNPSETITCNLSTEGLDKKNYYLRVRIDGKNKSCYCIVIPVSIK